MFIIRLRKLFFAIAAATMSLSVFAILVFGINPGIDFAGGSILEVTYDETKPANEIISNELEEAGYTGFTLQNIGEQGLVLKINELSDAEKEEVDELLTIDGGFTFVEERYKSIGPTISDELKNKSLFAIALVVVTIVLFIAYVFRAVSVPVSSYKYGFVAIVALIHDILIPTAIFALLGTFFLDYQIDVLFITALLAILGFSVNDTIVVFDRIRENLKIEIDKLTPGKKRRDDVKQYAVDALAEKEKGPTVHIPQERFEEIVGLSLDQTFRRSMNTSITTLLVLLLLFLIGGEVTRPFALTLSVGVLAGTYSSLFLASPLLVYLAGIQRDSPRPQKTEDPNEFKITKANT